MMVYKYPFKPLFSILWGIYPEMGLLDLMIILLNFLRNCHNFLSTNTIPFYIPISNAQDFQYLHILHNTWYFLLFQILYPSY